MSNHFSSIKSTGGSFTVAAAISDDLTISSTMDGICSALNEVIRISTAHNIPINRNKTFVLWPRSDIPPDEMITKLCSENHIGLEIGAAKYLGSAVGLDVSKRTKIIEEKMSVNTIRFLDIIGNKNLPVQAAPRLLQQCGISKASYAATAQPPSITAPVLRTFDSAILNALAHKLDIPIDEITSPDNIVIITQPICNGGMGLRSAVFTSRPAYLAALTRSIDFLPRDLLAHIRELPSPLPMFREAAQHANDIHEAFPGIIPSLIPVFDKHCIPQRHSDLKADASIQNLLTHAMENATAQEIHNNTNKTSLSKRIHAMSDSIARRFQYVLGSEPQTTLSDLNSRLFYRKKFNLHAESSNIPVFCACGAQFTPDHPFSCHLLRADPNKPDNVLRRLSPVTQRHDAIIESSLVPALRNCGVAFSVVKRVSTIVRLKPDLAIEFNDKSTDCLADLQVIHSYSPSYVHTVIEKQLAIAEQGKRNKYEQFWNSTETGPLRDFYGLIITTDGILSKQFITCILKLANHAQHSQMLPFGTSVTDFAHRLIDHIHTSLHTGNSQILMAGLKLARRGIDPRASHPLDPSRV